MVCLPISVFGLVVICGVHTVAAKNDDLLSKFLDFEDAKWKYADKNLATEKTLWRRKFARQQKELFMMRQKYFQLRRFVKRILEKTHRAEVAEKVWRHRLSLNRAKEQIMRRKFIQERKHLMLENQYLSVITFTGHTYGDCEGTYVRTNDRRNNHFVWNKVSGSKDTFMFYNSNHHWACTGSWWRRGILRAPQRKWFSYFSASQYTKGGLSTARFNGLRITYHRNA